jgi:PKD repeat protein/C1A family cysteine protease
MISKRIKGINMKKTTRTYIELLVLFLVIGLSILIAGIQFAEKNETSNVQENATNNNQIAVSPKLEPAPENPEFIKYHNNKLYTQKEPSKEEHKTGLIPAPVDLSHLSDISAGDISAPTNYDLRDVNAVSRASNTQAGSSTSDYYDLRALNRVTTVKDQGYAGACWAFATYASLESYLKPGEDKDFSENNMKNLLSSDYPEGFDRNAEDGGNIFMSTAYLARWSGPVAESDDPYSYNSGSSSQNLPLQKHVQDVFFIPDRKNSLDNQAIKWAVQNRGAVFTSMYYDDFYSPSTYSYYYNGASSSNHAVTIVGWNDSFDRNRFSRAPPGNGAFIVKNSWGPGWGENGYFYISYYDSNIGTCNSVVTAENTDNYKSIYQYDPLGWTQDVGYGAPTSWCANIFTTKSDSALKAVSFYTTDSNCNYEIYIYTDPKSNPVSQAGPVLSKSGSSPAAGYHTVPLGSEVQLKSGQKFSVVLKLTTPAYNYPIAVERPFSGWSSKAKANSGESFISYDGNNWDDITTYFKNTNVCIKAFTVQGSVFPVANFSATPTTGNAPLNVAFTDTSTGTPTALNWSFGDGTSSTIKNPTHTYSAAGNYTVALTATNAAGSNTVTKSIYVNVANTLKPPVAAFSASRTSGNAPLNIAFTDRSTGTPTSWNWSFGDGKYSTTRNPTHTYSAAGNYTVALTATNSGGSNAVTKSNYVNIANALKPPFAAFSASQISGNAPLNVTFTDMSTGTPTSWNWNFGDRTSSTGKNPVHTYSKAGKYTVSLRVSNAAGSNVVTKSSYINVVNVLKAPGTAFSASPTSGNAPLKVTFTDTSTGTPTAWNWNFGDGTSSTGKNPVHTYSKAGKYTVSLRVRNTAGSSVVTKSSYINVVNVLKAPSTAFSASPTTGKAPLKVTFTDTSTGTPTAWNWNFGDGTSSTVKNPVQTYRKAGKYTVSLTVKNDNGSNTVTKSGYVTVTNK